MIRTVELRRQFALDLHIVNIAFEADRAQGAGESRRIGVASHRSIMHTIGRQSGSSGSGLSPYREPPEAGAVRGLHFLGKPHHQVTKPGVWRDPSHCVVPQQDFVQCGHLEGQREGS